MHGTEPPMCSSHWHKRHPSRPARSAPRPTDAVRRRAVEDQSASRTDSAGTAHAARLGPGIIADIIEDLAEKQRVLSKYIDDNLDELGIAAMAQLLHLLGQNASRLGRLLRDQRALSGEAADGIAGAIAQALDELSNELGADL